MNIFQISLLKSISQLFYFLLKWKFRMYTHAKC
jgi:hypothetical protein